MDMNECNQAFLTARGQGSDRSDLDATINGSMVRPIAPAFKKAVRARKPGLVGGAGAATQQVVGQSGIAESVFQHVAQRAVQVRSDDRNFRWVQVARGHQLHQRVSQLDDHLAAITTTNGAQERLLCLGKWFGGMHELVFHQIGQMG